MLLRANGAQPMAAARANGSQAATLAIAVKYYSIERNNK